MKPKFIIMFLVLLLSISISACSRNKNSSNLSINNSTNNNKSFTNNVSKNNTTFSKNQGSLEIEAYKAVMQNKVNFFSMGDYFSDDKKYVYLDDLLKAPEMSKNPALKVTHFTVLDMDGDKTPEVVLELSFVGNDYPGFYEVLHYMSGKVYGYNVVYRGLEGLKTDGTFWSSGGAADNSCNKMRFSSNGYGYDVLGYSQSNSNNDDIPISYFINNKTVTEKIFNSFIKKQDEKEDVIWYDFSQKDIETELSNK